MNPASRSTAPSVRQEMIEVRIVFLLRTEKLRARKKSRAGAGGRAAP